MTYEESAALMVDTIFRGRIEVAGLKYADSIYGEPTTTPAHNTRLNWARSMVQNPIIVAQQLQPPVVMDSQVQTDGKNITDTALQGSVEAVINKQF